MFNELLKVLHFCHFCHVFRVYIFADHWFIPAAPLCSADGFFFYQGK